MEFFRIEICAELSAAHVNPLFTKKAKPKGMEAQKPKPTEDTTRVSSPQEQGLWKKKS